MKIIWFKGDLGNQVFFLRIILLFEKEVSS